jgi:CrcB protein
MMQIVAVALGGAIGSVGRHFVAGWFGRLLGIEFPWGTLAVNVIGGLVMGALVEAMALKWNLNPEMRAFLTVGLLGGFTTFSAFSLDVVLLAERGELAQAIAYALGSVVLSVGALVVGLRAVRLLLA